MSSADGGDAGTTHAHDPSDDSVWRPSEGGGNEQGSGDSRPPPRDDHGSSQWDHAHDPWAAWNDYQQPSWWGHSSWGDRSGWWQGYDWRDQRRWSLGDTWGTSSTNAGSGPGSADGSAGNDHKSAPGWSPGDNGWDDASRGVPRRPENSRGPSEKMVVPTFDGEINSTYDDLGSSARSYVRQVSAWRRMTPLSADQQALTLYQNLSGKAWVDAEKLHMDRLAASDGVDYFLGWIKERYLDVQITQVGRSLSGFFRGLRRKPTQTVREYLSEFDRAYARLNEVGCCLPDVAAAWVFVDRVGLDEQAELNLLASVGNVYDLQQLQKAAIVHDRTLRKPWETMPKNDRNPRREWLPRRNHSALLTGHDDGEEDFLQEDGQPEVDDDEIVPEDVAAEYYETFMTHESAKQRYKETLKLRGSDPESLKKLSEDRLQAAKARSYCAGCRRRGHWHRDACCPLNKAAAGTSGTTSSGTSPPTSGQSLKPANPPPHKPDGGRQHVVHVTWDLQDQGGPDLMAITDTACSRSVAGINWINSYVALAKQKGFSVEFVHIQEAFRFGASRVFEARHAAVIYFPIGEKIVGLKIAVVYGEVPLLISRPALALLGMIMDVARNVATFRAVGVIDLPLKMTETGHPAFPVQPVDPKSLKGPAMDWQSQEIGIFSRAEQYMVFALESVEPLLGEVDVRCNKDPKAHHEPHHPQRVFHPKRIAAATNNLLLADVLNRESFLAWWSQTSISNDFWIEGEHIMVRVHVVPRNKTFFNPTSWSTPKHELKANLLQSLGFMRVVNAVLSEMKKDELLREAAARNLPVNPRWTVVEIRSVIQEDMSTEATSATSSVPPVGLSKMTLQELKEKVVEIGLEIPAKATRGILMRMVRDNGGKGPETILTFGRYQGMRYMDTPTGYRTWAVREVVNNDNASEDLRMFAAWWKAETESRGVVHPPTYMDPESSASIPYVPNESEDSAAWERVSSYVPAKAKAKWSGYQAAPLTTTPKRRSAPSESSFSSRSRMDQDIPEEILDEVQHLEERLAILRDYDEIYFEDDEEKLDFLRNQVAPLGVSREDAIYNGEIRNEKNDFKETNLENSNLYLNHGPAECVQGQHIKDSAERGYESAPGLPGHVLFEETKLENSNLYPNHGPNVFENAEKISVESFPEVFHSDTEDFFEIASGEEHSIVQEGADFQVLAASDSSSSTTTLRCEALAREKLRTKAFSFADLYEIVQLIPLRKTKKHRCISGGAETTVNYFFAGLYTHGVFSGITKGTEALPWVTRYINAFGRDKTNGSWSSWILNNKNVKSSVHSDSHNLVGTNITTMCFGDFSGGELWVEDDAADIEGDAVFRTDAFNKTRKGKLISTKQAPLVLDPKRKHCTEAWQGDRWTLAFFTPRGFPESTPALRDRLRDLRFPLRGLPIEEHRHDFARAPRPPKSTRKGLWKAAKRLASMTAWCTMAATSWATTDFPLGKKQGAPTLFEVGDVTKTLEAGDFDYVCMEPLLPEDLGPPNVFSEAKDNLVKFEPETVWVHVEKIKGSLGPLQQVFEAQACSGRPLVFEFPEDKNDITGGELEDFIEKYDGHSESHDGKRRLVRINVRENSSPDLSLPQGDRASFLFESYMASGGARGSDDPPPEVLQRGAEAISFTKGGSPRPASIPNLLEFNQVVALDAFTTYDAFDDKVELLMAVDLGTGFCLASELDGHSGKAMEATFCRMWSQTFGAPGTLVLDLETGLQAGLARFSEWHGTLLRPIAAQAHWQQGVVERCIRTWKEVWVRTVDDKTVTRKEAPLAITSVNSAMNTLRRQSGFSPSQAVWGRDPRLPEDLSDHQLSEHFHHVLSKDRVRAREHTLRVAAKESFFKVKNDEKLRRALLQRTRVSGSDLEIGMHVFMYRKPKDSKNWKWFGPATVIGREGGNYWASFAGRCHLIAPEHIRIATGEELGAAFTLRATKEDLEKLLEVPFADEAIFAGDDGDQGDDDLALPPGDGDAMDDQEPEEEGAAFPPVAKRYRTKGPQDAEDDVFDELLVSTVGPEKKDLQTVYMMKLPKTPRANEKALEKEIPWSLIPEDQHEGFRAAERTQYDEHIQHDALEPLSVEESREILRTKHDRVLSSRFAYKDKFWSKRKEHPDIGWKHKARLVIAGHRDPDLMNGLNTHAPTVSRQGILLLLQILASNLHRGWTGHAGDVSAAFLCGELYGEHGRVWVISNCSLDHCIFIVQEEITDEEGRQVLREPEAYIGVHVDDVLLVGDNDLCRLIQKELSAEFPIKEWESGSFEYVGSYIDIKEDMIMVSQASYTTTRLFEVEVHKEQSDEDPASEVQKHDNMSLIGALSWLASQSRPDLQVGVSMCQQRQRDPLVSDIKFTNLMAQRAYEHQKEGVRIFPIDLDRATLLCFHDAGWANAPQNQEDPYYKLTPEEDQLGMITSGPMSRSEARAKRANSSVCSQLGGLFLLADNKVLQGGKHKVSTLDWRSGACDRVCRSTFAAETMACATAIETGIFISRFLETLLTGKLARNSSRLQLRFLSDCRSLYDHLIRDGVPRVPSCKRLAIDLAAIRDDLSEVGRIAWVPTGAQMADHLTKPLKAADWWQHLSDGLELTFREDPV
ncbi:GIP [Symbiodinium sp. CCMP2592]|nr:GIP [Symbiodinium sp. CCMP2592]